MIAVSLLGTPAAAVTFTVRITEFAFTPNAITLSPGDQVTWINNGTVVHSVTWTKSRVGSKDIQPGTIYFETFTDPGTYSYQCRFHPLLMQGSVTVVGATPTPTPAPTPAPTPTATPKPSETPTPPPSPAASPSPTPPPPTASPQRTSPPPTARPTATPSPTATPLTNGVSASNTTVGIALIVAGIGVLGATLWWRFGRSA